jgi:fatty-acyl-CoA synthase
VRQAAAIDPAEVRAFVKARISGVEAPKEVLVWDDLPRSKVGKVVKPEIRAQLLRA